MRAESDASKVIEPQKGLTLHPQHSISTADLAIGARLESNPRNAPPKRGMGEAKSRHYQLEQISLGLNRRGFPTACQ
jgi:hypothetical protein